jgi:ZIP family zinc transporter
MLNAFLWGILATSSLVLGGLLGIWFKPGRRTLGVIMAFGAGVLISAVAYELILEAVHLAAGSGRTALGFAAGALTFFIIELLIEKIGAGERKAIESTGQSEGADQAHLVVPLVLAIILDGIPESTMVGLSILEGGSVSIALLVAVFMSNLPEAIAGTTGLRAKGRTPIQILLLWTAIALICGAASAAGFGLLADASDATLAFLLAFAAGAIMIMLANTMMPEAYAHGGKLAGLFTILGFAVSVAIVIFERTH